MSRYLPPPTGLQGPPGPPGEGGLPLTGGTLTGNLTVEGSSTLGIATLASATLTTPTIGNFTNANHTHTGATSGGTITLDTLTDTVVSSPQRSHVIAYDGTTFRNRAGPFFDVHDFGAVGNGSTDDRAAVQAAFDAAFAAGGGTVSFRALTYRINSTLAAKHRVALLGVRGGTILQLPLSSTSQLLYNPDQTLDIPVDDLTLENIIFDANGLATDNFAASCVAVNGVRRFRAVGCVFRNATGYGLGFQSSYSHPTINGPQEEIWLEDCIFENNGKNATVDAHDGVDVKAPSARIMSRGLIARNNGDKGIEMRGTDVSLQGCIAYGNGRGGIQALTGPSQAQGQISISDSHAHNNGEWGIMAGLVDSAGTVGRMSFSNIFAYDNTLDGIMIQLDTAPDLDAELLFSNVFAWGNGASGLNVPYDARVLTISNSAFSTNVLDGVRTSTVGASFTNCHFLGNAGYGFRETNSANTNKLLGCHFETNTLGPTLLIGSGSRTLLSSGTRFPIDLIPMRPDLYAYVYDDFVSGGVANNTVGSLGWNRNGSSSLLSGEENRPGIVQLLTTTTALTHAYYRLLESVTGPVRGADTFEMTWIVRPNQADAETRLRIGLAANAGATDPINGVYLEKLDTDTNWFLVTRASSVETRTVTGVAVGTTWLRVRLRRVDASTIGVRLNNGVEVTATANIPAVGLAPFVAVRNASTTQKSMDIDFFDLMITGISR